MGAHTPGPWCVREDIYGVDIKVPWPDDAEIKDHSPAVAYVPIHRNLETDPRADAQLIAASPAMLQALKTALAELRREHESFRACVTTPHGAVPDPDDAAELQRLDALITECAQAVAEAEGEG